MSTQWDLPTYGIWSGLKGLGGIPADRFNAYIEGLEAAGCRMVWIAESLGREVMSAATLILARTNLTVGTGVANMWARDPTAMNAGARTIGDAFPGRLVMALGISHRTFVAPRGQEYDSPFQRTRSYLERMNAAPWMGPEALMPVPRLLGAQGPKMMALAAELLDGAHPYLVTPEHTSGAREILGPHAFLAPEQGIVLSADPTAARAAARAHLVPYLGLPNYVRSWKRQGLAEDDFANGGSDRLVDAMIAWGDDESVAKRIDAHRQAGANHVALQILVADGGPTELESLGRILTVLESA